MTKVCVYGVTDARELGSPGPLGQGGAAVTAFPVGGLAALVSDAAEAEVEPTVENVWRYEQVLAGLMERHAVLPMRFGTVCEPDRLASVLEARRESLSATLDRVRGKVEIAIRLSDAPSAVRDPIARSPGAGRIGRPGTAYLMARMGDCHEGEAMGDRARPAVREIRDRLNRLSVETVWDEPAEPRAPIKASCLIWRDSLSDFVQAVQALAARHRDVTVSCTGPWAPYSFVGKSVADGDEG